MADNVRKAVWAVDPFGTDKQFQLKVAKTLAKVLKDTSTSIEPVCVLSPDQLRIPKQEFQSGHGNYRLEADRILQTWLKSLKIPGMLSPTFLVSEDFSVRSSVRKLVDYAKTSGVSMIGLGTHSKKAVHRFFFGSFAETMVFLSDCPALVVSPRVKTDFNAKRVLFPTDFSERSKQAFEKLLGVASEKKAQVVLFHKAQFEVPPVIYGFDPSPLYREFLARDLSDKKKQAETWVRLASSKNVKVEVVFNEKPGSAVDAILSAATKQKCGWMALASITGPVAAAFLGSISRQVIRHSPCPTWVLHA